jgi:hypothetical protein
MTNDRQEARLNGEIHDSIDEDLWIFARGFLNLLDRVSAVFSLTDTVTGHKGTILNQIVNEVFIIRLASAFFTLVLLVESYTRDFTDYAKASATKNSAKFQF